MIYWLFTQGRSILAGLALPLLCVGVAAPVAFVSLLGFGIQRRADGTQLQTTGLWSTARALCFLLPSLALVAADVSLFGEMAVTRAASRQTPLHGLAAVIVGGPRVCVQTGIDWRHDKTTRTDRRTVGKTQAAVAA